MSPIASYAWPAKISGFAPYSASKRAMKSVATAYASVPSPNASGLLHVELAGVARDDRRFLARGPDKHRIRVGRSDLRQLR